VAGRRREYRTWEEFSASERRRGLLILGGFGVVAVGAVVWVFGGTGAGAGTPVGAPAPALAAAAGGTPSPSASVPDLSAWYAAIDGYRTDIGAAEADVRKAIADQNGTALKPACALLQTRATAADGDAGVAPPAGDEGTAWTEGLRAFRDAMRSCGQLFDGTQVPPPTLLTETSTALDTADAAWSRLSLPGTRTADAAGTAGPPAATTAAVPG
jgi:hypothetical protein